MTKEIFTTTQAAKARYANEGFGVIGLFGSQARGSAEESSDVDLLYELSPVFMEKHPGFTAFARLEEIKKELEALYRRPVDLCARSGLNEVGEKYILKDLIRVG